MKNKNSKINIGKDKINEYTNFHLKDGFIYANKNGNTFWNNIKQIIKKLDIFNIFF